MKVFTGFVTSYFKLCVHVPTGGNPREKLTWSRIKVIYGSQIFLFASVTKQIMNKPQNCP